MSFWDNVKKFAQPYGDEDYDDYDDEVDVYEEEDDLEPAPRSSRRASSDNNNLDFGFGSASAAPAASGSSASGFSGTVLNTSSGKQEVVLFRPTSFNDTSKAADHLRNKKAVVVNMENVDKAMTRRVVDFLSGCAYAVDGKVKKIAQSTYLFTPHNMDVTGDLENIQSEVESYV